jgi:REase_AHJR-like protein
MASNVVRREEARLYDIAEEYKKRGYKVTVSPRAKELPKFLSGFKPDLVAERARESVVVEVPSPSRKRGSDYWTELSSVVQKHPGWRLDLVINGSPEQAPKTMDGRSVLKRLEEGRRLAEQGMLAAALLIIWSAAEAAMRFASKQNEIDLPDLRPATVITRLYTDGVIEREEYDFLLESMRMRDTVAHGFDQGRIKAGSLKRLQQISLRLLG